MKSNAVILENPRFSWQLNWKVCLFSLLFLPLLVGLGFWQLSRAEQKRTLQQQLAEQQALQPLVIQTLAQLSDLTEAEGRFRSVVLHGHYDAQRIWLIENQFFNGKLGYQVVQAFMFSDRDGVLVNRGWIPGTGQREQLPHVDTERLPGTAVGRLVIPSVNRLLQGQSFADFWPQLILQVAPQDMAEQSGLKLSSWIVQIDPVDRAAFQVHWQNVIMPAGQHRGYALQWFLMALALAILTLYANSNIHRYLKAKLQR